MTRIYFMSIANICVVHGAYHRLTTCFLHIGLCFGNLVLNESWFVSLTKRKTMFSLFLILFIYMYLHIDISRYNITLFFINFVFTP